MTTTTIKSPKKLIEVALPLDDINAAAAREKSIRHGHPSTLHLWWARRPLAAAPAVIFAQMVNDPGYQQDGGFKYGVNKQEAEIKREKLFAILRDLVKWENTNNEEVLERAREAIRESWREICHLNRDHPQAAELFNPDTLPAFHDPFAGGGALPLEAQRLGLEAYASDLNPVAVMINKAMIEIPPKFAGRAPVGPIPEGDKQPSFQREWPGATGLAEDVRRYGHWLKSPNPAFSHVDVPLASSFVLSSKKGKEAWVEPVVEEDRYRFEIRKGEPPSEAKNGTKLGRGANFSCLFSEVPIQPKYIYAQAQAGHLGQRLMAIVAEGKNGRVYLNPDSRQEGIANSAQPDWAPTALMPENPRWFSPPMYGMKSYGDLFTPRQLVALTTFSDLVQEAREKTIADAKAAGMADDGLGVEGGMGVMAYGDALAVYLAFVVDRGSDFWSKDL